MYMSISKIPTNAFIIKEHAIIKYKPEIELMYETLNDTVWKCKFPYYPNVIYKNLQLTNVGLYSIVSPDNSANLITILCEINTQYKFVQHMSDLVVTDATAGVGGFAIRLTKIFKLVNIVEINKTHMDIIKHNLRTYNINLHNVNLHNVDYMSIMHTLQQDIIVFDLPWCGPKYKLEKDMLLGLNNVNIWYIINDLHKNNKFKVCVVLVPKNFNFQDFINNITATTIIIKKTNLHFYIIIIA